MAAPRGNGVPTWRAWEALAVGAVPIIQRTADGSHAALYAGLPVLEIGPSSVRPVRHEAWTEVTPALLEAARADIERRAAAGEYDLRSAFMPYWIARMFNRSIAQAPRNHRAAVY